MCVCTTMMHDLRTDAATTLMLCNCHIQYVLPPPSIMYGVGLLRQGYPALRRNRLYRTIPRSINRIDMDNVYNARKAAAARTAAHAFAALPQTSSSMTSSVGGRGRKRKHGGGGGGGMSAAEKHEQREQIRRRKHLDQMDKQQQQQQSRAASSRKMTRVKVTVAVVAAATTTTTMTRVDDDHGVLPLAAPQKSLVGPLAAVLPNESRGGRGSRRGEGGRRRW